MHKDPLRASIDEAPSSSHGLRPVLDRSGSVSLPSSPRHSRRIRKFLAAKAAVLAVAVLVSSTVIFALTSLPAKTQAYTPHLPISITESFHWVVGQNGIVSGSGNPDDPYIISGWEITIGSGAGITIISYEGGPHFMIVDVHVNGTANPTGPVTGIEFINVYNGQIKGCLINDTNTGLDFWYCYDCSVQETEFLDISGSAADLSQCFRVHFVGSYFDSGNGIVGSTWQNSVVVLNEFLCEGTCVDAVDAPSLVVKENVFHECASAIQISGSTDVSVMNNHLEDSEEGIVFHDVTWSFVIGNVIYRAGVGVSVTTDSYTIKVHDNIVSDSYGLGGVYVAGSRDVSIIRNLLSNNIADTVTYGITGGGVTLHTGCTQMVVCNNTFVDNIPYQAQDDNGDFINRWNWTYPYGGNYWSDYTGKDEKSGPDQSDDGPDGFGDSDYEIDATTNDHYPRMTLVPATIRPVAVPSAAPLPGGTSAPITFDGSSSYHPDSGKSITGYRWDFDGNGVFDPEGYSSDPISMHLYPMPGTYTVILEVVDEVGMTDMETIEVTIIEGEIPEFGTVLIPVLSVVVLVAVAFRRRSQIG